MKKQEGIFTPYLDLDEHLLWMGERAKNPRYLENIVRLYLGLLGIGYVTFALGLMDTDIVAYIFRVVGAICFILIPIEYKYQIFLPSSVWYGVTTKRLLIKLPSRLKQVDISDLDKVIIYPERLGYYAIAIRSKSGRLIMSNILLHQIREIIPLLQEYTSAEIEMPKLPDQSPTS